MSRRTISWSAALAELRADRARPLDVREERLRSSIGIRGQDAGRLSAWRGASGKRYVVRLVELDANTLTEQFECVALAVARDANGEASIRRATSDIAPADVSAWITAARADGATELHIHSLAADEERRADVVSDLVVIACEREAA